MTEPKLVSKCCGADVQWMFNDERYDTQGCLIEVEPVYMCLGCGSPCKVESKEGGGKMTEKRDYKAWLTNMIEDGMNLKEYGSEEDWAMYRGILKLIEQHFVVMNFSQKISHQKDCPPEFMKLANKHFWELIEDSEQTEPSEVDLDLLWAKNSFMDDYADCYMTKEQFMEAVKQLLQRQPRKVTREWAEILAKGIQESGKQGIKVLEEALYELGVEVEDG